MVTWNPHGRTERRDDHCKFKASLNYTLRPWVNKTKLYGRGEQPRAKGRGSIRGRRGSKRTRCCRASGGEQKELPEEGTGVLMRPQGMAVIERTGRDFTS